MRAAEKLRDLIQERGITYTFLSIKTALPVDLISKSLRGQRRLTADEFIALCDALGLDLGDWRNG